MFFHIPKTGGSTVDATAWHTNRGNLTVLKRVEDCCDWWKPTAKITRCCKYGSPWHLTPDVLAVWRSQFSSTSLRASEPPRRPCDATQIPCTPTCRPSPRALVPTEAIQSAVVRSLAVSTTHQHSINCSHDFATTHTHTPKYNSHILRFQLLIVCMRICC